MERGVSSMDGAGNIFDRIEQKLSALGVNADISDLQKAAGEYDAKISNNPADLDSKMIDLELKVVMLARLLNASIDALETRGVAAAAMPAAAAEESAAPGSGTGPGPPARPRRSSGSGRTPRRASSKRSRTSSRTTSSWRIPGRDSAARATRRRTGRRASSSRPATTSR